jgi:PAS domain S-box-containing protein
VSFPQFHLDFLLFAAASFVVFAGAHWWLNQIRHCRVSPVAWVALGALLCFAWVATDSADRRQRAESKKLLVGLGRLYAAELERMGHAKLGPGTAPDDPLYLELIEAEKRWQLLNKSAHDIYTIRKYPGGKNRFIVDSETDYDRNGRFEGEREERTKFEEVYETPDPGLEAALQGNEIFEDTPISDEWGTWVSAFIPMHDATGRMEAVLGVDYDAAEYLSAVAGARLRAIGVFAGLQLILLSSTVVISLLRGRMAERKLATQALAESEARFRAFMDNTPAFAFLKDERGRYLYLNTMLAKFLGRDPEDVAGRTDADLFPADVVEKLRSHDNEVLASGKAAEFTETVLGADGTLREAWVFKFPVADTGGNRMVGGIALDVTERRQLEEQLRQSQKMQTVGQLAAGIAHEFNNILTIIIGSSEEIPYCEGVEAKARGYARNITAAAERAAGLVRQLVTFSQKHVIMIRRLDLNETVSGTGAIIRPLLGESISFEFLPGANLPQIEADPDMIEQMLLNLALNARDAMRDAPERRLTITTSLVVVDAGTARANADAHAGLMVQLTVRDTGRGIDEETRAHLFEPFFTTKEVGQGPGLGLATVYGIVKQHKGWIEVETSVGRGTAFHVFLPAAPASTGEPQPAPVLEGRQETILLVEDEIVVRRIIREALLHYGYRILEADSGTKALPVWEAHKGEVDILITDMVMPDGMTGAELSRRLRAEKPGLRVIHMTGYSADIAGKDLASEAGTRFLQKPFTPQKLAACIREVFNEEA